MRREREDSVVFNGGRLIVPGKRRVGIVSFALLVTVLMTAAMLLAAPAWSKDEQSQSQKKDSTRVGEANAVEDPAQETHKASKSKKTQDSSTRAANSSRNYLVAEKPTTKKSVQANEDDSEGDLVGNP